MIQPNIPRPTLAAMVVLLLLQAQVVLAEDWQPVTGAQTLTDFISGKTLVWQEG
jgi:hypothetical protein